MKETVCVTGSSGYIASWLVKLLLKHGYIVNATVRSLSDPSKVAHLKALEGAKERLHLFEANLLDEGSFDAAVDGCDGVFHTASPVTLDSVNDPKAELIDPAVKGTLNVLKSCAEVSSIRHGSPERRKSGRNGRSGTGTAMTVPLFRSGTDIVVPMRQIGRNAALMRFCGLNVPFRFCGVPVNGM